jgi:hypothetical protein
MATAFDSGYDQPVYLLENFADQNSTPPNLLSSKDENSQIQTDHLDFEVHPAIASPPMMPANTQWAPIPQSTTEYSPYSSFSLNTPGFISDPSSHSSHTQSSECLPQLPPQFEEPSPFIEQPSPQFTTQSWSTTDPFMGCADKRGSWNLEDYDWVLSHVETL